MQATRASTTVSVFADCSIPAGLRIGPVPGIFKLGKYVSDRKEVGPKKKVSLKDFKDKIYMFISKLKVRFYVSGYAAPKNAFYFEIFESDAG